VGARAQGEGGVRGAKNGRPRWKIGKGTLWENKKDQSRTRKPHKATRRNCRVISTFAANGWVTREKREEHTKHMVQTRQKTGGQKEKISSAETKTVGPAVSRKIHQKTKNERHKGSSQPCRQALKVTGKVKGQGKSTGQFGKKGKKGEPLG